jgi:hypothetical protein
MQTLALNLGTTFIDDALALVTGPARALLRIVTAPIDRIANACDVAGVLAGRRAAFRLWQASRAQRERGPSLFARLSPFRHLAHLT